MKIVSDILAAQALPNVIHVWAGPPVIAYERGDDIPPEHQPTASLSEVVTDALMEAVQQHLDAKACAMGYDNIISAVSYSGEAAVPKYQTEGRALRAWRSLCWAKCEEVQTAVLAGQRAIPTAAELIAELPAL